MPTPAELRVEIIAKCSPEIRAEHNTQLIADTINVGRMKLSPTRVNVGNGQVIAAFGVDEAGILLGNTFLDWIYADNNMRHVKTALSNAVLDAAAPLTQAMLQSYVPSKLTQPQADALMNLGKVPDPISEFEVRSACWSDEGVWLV